MRFFLFLLSGSQFGLPLRNHLLLIFSTRREPN